MKRNIYILILLAAALPPAMLPCTNISGEGEERGEIVKYKSSSEDFCNPERGFYTQYSVKFENGKIPSTLTSEALQVSRVSKRTLTLTLFYLTDFMEGDISDAALQVIRQCLQAHRDAGFKTVLRFAYKNNYGKGYEPYDPEVDIVLRHVAQLKPVFAEYGDIILVLQAGFVGSWGEWYYTSHFNFNPKTSEQFEPRRRLLRALLDAMPADRQVALRTPGYKTAIFGTALKDSITAETAFTASDIARVGGHNDCFISDGTDVGTYTSAADRELWAAETNYTLMGGETCSGSAMFCDCVPAYKALEAYHWTYQNRGYHSGTFALWQKNGCLDDISRRLGYRLVLERAAFDSSLKAGSDMNVVLTVRNDGFASPVNPRGMEFVLVEKSTGEKTVFRTEIDPRHWKGGSTTKVRAGFSLPSGLRSGAEYSLFLNLPDGRDSLHDDPRYSIRLANRDVWDEDTGYNLIYEFIAQ